MAYQVLNINQPNSTSENVLGINLPFNGTKGLFTPVYTTVNQAISNLKNLLLTVKGERINQPTFGTNLVRLLFEPNTNLIKQNIQDVITQPVNYWLPYINIVEIKTITAEDDPNLDHTISVRITFQVTMDLTTNTAEASDALSTITLNVTNNQIAIVDGN